MDFSNPKKLFNSKTQDIQISLIRAFDQEVQNIEGIIRLTMGQPDFPTPKHVKNAGISAINNDLTSYTHSNGDIKVREAASSFVRNKYNIHYNAESEVITTVGATEALTTALFTVINPGDKILIPEPFFSIYESIVILAGGEPIFIDTTSNGFVLSPEMIEKEMKKHGDGVKAIILNYPTNPTGITWNRQECQAIAKTLKEYPDVFVISDEIYSEFVYEGKHVSMGEYLGEQTIVINGISKSHSMTGWRIGFTFAPEEITNVMTKVHPYLVTSTSTMSQFAAIEALTKGMDDAIPMKKEYLQRRDFIYNSLTKLGFEMPKPNGAFYAYAKIPEGFIQDSYKFCVDLAQKAKVAVIPGVAFGDAGENYIRISYASDMEKLKEAMKRMSSYMNEHKK